MVGVAAGQLPDVQGHAGGVGQGLEEVFHQLRVVGADALCGDGQVVAQVGPPRQVLLKAEPMSSECEYEFCLGRRA